MKRKEQAEFSYKGGFTKFICKNISDDHLEKLRQEVCKEQIKRKEAQPFGKAAQSKMTFGKKLRRFIRRLAQEADYKINTVVVNCIVGSEQAANINYIGIEDCTNGRAL
jgi:hypothetical protein